MRYGMKKGVVFDFFFSFLPAHCNRYLSASFNCGVVLSTPWRIRVDAQALHGCSKIAYRCRRSVACAVISVLWTAINY